MPAQRHAVRSTAPGRSHLAGRDHFELADPVDCDPRTVIDEPGFVIYAIDDEARAAVFTRSSAPIADMLAAPFFYQAQKETATELVTMGFAELHELASDLPDPERLGLLYSTGRCGSTLLGRALAATTGATVVSEPDGYTTLVGMRDPDGSADDELVRLARSITRLLEHACRSVGGQGLVIKFRGWCTHIGDLIQQAQPEASAIFLTRDLEGWMRSMARMVRIGDPAREQAFDKQQRRKFRFPLDRFIRMPELFDQPETRVENLTLTWVSLMSAYLDLHRRGIVTDALDYRSLLAAPEQAIAAVSRCFRLEPRDPGALSAVLAADSQAGTALSGRTLARNGAGELTPADLEASRRFAARGGVDPDVIASLPGRML